MEAVLDLQHGYVFRMANLKIINLKICSKNSDNFFGSAILLINSLQWHCIGLLKQNCHICMSFMIYTADDQYECNYCLGERDSEFTANRR